MYLILPISQRINRDIELYLFLNKYCDICPSIDYIILLSHSFIKSVFSFGHRYSSNYFLLMKYIISLFLSCTPLVVMSSLYATTISTNSTFCTADYAPVCGSLQVQCIKAPCNPIQQTFPNKCMAQAASATQITS